jgi:hypothetical protein
MIEHTMIMGVEVVVMEVDLARRLFWLRSHLIVRQAADPHTGMMTNTLQFSTGPFLTRFPRTDGHTRNQLDLLLFALLGPYLYE